MENDLEQRLGMQKGALAQHQQVSQQTHEAIMQQMDAQNQQMQQAQQPEPQQ
jgi:hypothetical protein